MTRVLWHRTGLVVCLVAAGILLVLAVFGPVVYFARIGFLRLRKLARGGMLSLKAHQHANL
jgi:hypothetical protein